MSLVTPLTDFKQYSPFSQGGVRLFWGRVIDNRDPKMLHRCKIQIHDTLPFENSNQLPWVYPKFPIGVGQGPLSATQSVPEIDSYVLVEFPLNTPYFGFYVGTLSDRLRRQPDLLSEYPERYGWVDSIENKHITNKAPRVNAVEQRWADGTLHIHDSRESTNLYKDKYGTQIYIDRKNQYLSLSFGGIKLHIKEGRINLEAPELHLEIWRLFRLVSKDVIHLFAKKSFQIGGKLLTAMTKRSHTADEKEVEGLPTHNKQGDLG